MKTMKGDLIQLAKEGVFDVIVHGCNCFHTMGAGFAAQVKEHFPEAWQADLATLSGLEKLGTISWAKTACGVVVVNAYTQGEPGPKLDYDALRLCFREVKEKFPDTLIGYPKIGAGIAAGNWGVISMIIWQELDGEDHTYVEYDPPKGIGYSS